MTWLAWRQFRTQAAVALGALGLLAVVILITGLRLRHLYDSSGIATCGAHGDCEALKQAFVSHDTLLQNLLGPILLAVPVVIGMFWGAPLLGRELESGTYRLAWTQSITRVRWLAVKVLLVGLASIAAAEIVSLLVTWWSAPIDHVNMNRLTPSVFDRRGIVAIGYTAFAFALGLTAGALIRRTLPAMASTLVAFVIVRVLVNGQRAHLQAPLKLVGSKHTGPIGVAGGGIAPPLPGAWLLSATTQAKCTIGTGAGARTCPDTPFRVLYTYQPASRFWSFQIYETAIFLALALILIGFCLWWQRRSSPHRFSMRPSHSYHHPQPRTRLHSGAPIEDEAAPTPLQPLAPHPLPSEPNPS
jgi:ABC-type transport system involved in multi-copper enzyme maturation permease subunit